MGVDSWFEDVAQQLIRRDSRIDSKRMLRSPGLRFDGRFFVARGDGELALKLPPDRVDALVATAAGRAFMSGGRTMREWVYVRPGSKASCARYVEEALAFAARKPVRLKRSS